MTEMSEKGPPEGTLCTTPTGMSEARNGRCNPEGISETVKKRKKKKTGGHQARGSQEGAERGRGGFKGANVR